MGEDKDGVPLSDLITEIIRETPYKLKDIFNTSFKEGGLTISQIEVLYNGIQTTKLAEYEFLAKIHGAKLKSNNHAHEINQSSPKQDVPLFKSPEAYEYMSEEEKQLETQKMMEIHKRWAMSAFNNPSKM